MFMDNKEVESRVSNPENVLKKLGINTGDSLPVVLHKNVNGRVQGKRNMPIELQTLVGVTAHLDTLKETADEFGISVHHASELKRGKTNQSNINQELKRRIDDNLLSIQDKALAKTLEFIGMADMSKPGDDKLTSPEITRMAKDMAAIAEKVKPAETFERNTATVVFMGPRPKEIADYDIVEVEAREVD